MGELQIWLHGTLLKATTVAAFMRTDWGWPTIESLHFIGLTLLFGSIAVWDLRLLGVLPQVPVAAFHKLVPFAVVGFGINATTGFMFLVTYPDQYVYNPAFHFKLLCLLLAGANVLLFYMTTFRRITLTGSGSP